MSDEKIRQTIIDDEHLRLLSIGYMVSAGMSAFFSLFGLMYVVMGIIMGAAFTETTEAAPKAGQMPPQFVGWFFGIVGFVIFLIMITFAILKFRAALNIKRRRSRLFCMVVAGVSCLGIPYGTLLGVFTFIVLGRNSVIELFEPRIVP